MSANHQPTFNPLSATIHMAATRWLTTFLHLATPPLPLITAIYVLWLTSKNLSLPHKFLAM